MSDNSHDHLGHRQRLRERFCATGLDGFASHEVLELVLSYAIPRQDTNPLAHRLVEHFGSLHNVIDASVESLMRVEGIGERTAVLLALFSQMERKTGESRLMARQVLDNHEDVERCCVQLLKGCKVEHFYAICLNGQFEVLAKTLIAKGSISDVPAYPRIVADFALQHNAHAVVVCHNHPGGTLTPSPADVGATIRLHAVLEDLEVRLIDHILVANGQAVSIMNAGLMPTLDMRMITRNRAANSAGEITLQHRLAQQSEQETNE